MINKLREFYFVILLGNSFLIFNFIFGQEKEPNMIAASLSYMSVSILLILLFSLKNIMKKTLKFVNIIFFLIYILLGMVFVLIMEYASPDDKVYSFEALIFLLGILINVIFIFFKKCNN